MKALAQVPPTVEENYAFSRNDGRELVEDQCRIMKKPDKKSPELFQESCKTKSVGYKILNEKQLLKRICVCEPLLNETQWFRTISHKKTQHYFNLIRYSLVTVRKTESEIANGNTVYNAKERSHRSFYGGIYLPRWMRLVISASKGNPISGSSVKVFD